MEYVEFTYAVRRGPDVSVGRKRAMGSPELTAHEVRCIVAFGLNQSSNPA